MTEEEYFAIADGEALHFHDPRAIPWQDPSQAASFNELAHIIQYRWFREVIDTSGQVGAHLDIACGSGYGTAMLAKSSCLTSTVGADMNERHLAHARHHFQDVAFVHANAERLTEQFGELSFSFVTSGQTIEHLFDPVAFIFGVARILKPDGVFVLMSPTHNGGPVCLKPSNPWHLFEYDPCFLRDLLGFHFNDVQMGDDRPCGRVFDDLKRVAGDHVKVPTADAVVCRSPRTAVSDSDARHFRADFESRFYRAVIGQLQARVVAGQLEGDLLPVALQSIDSVSDVFDPASMNSCRTLIEEVQARMVAKRRASHFLRTSFQRIDLVSGVFNPEQGQMWTAPKAAIRIHPGKAPTRLTFKANGSPETPRQVKFTWDGGDRIFHVDNTGPQALKLDVSRSTVLNIEVSPPFMPGGRDMRALGISITDIL